ncbi:MAG: DUF1365 domain-containing protein [Acidimicrobiales bacterium]|nr:DUF1365 domain-containing protein [Acidimicrobiales bacterium]
MSVGPVACEAVPAEGDALLWTSALYEGTVSHARLDATAHAFEYQVLMAWLNLAELPGSLDAHPLWSARRAAPVRFRRQDFHGDPSVPLDEAVRTTIAEQSGERPEGPICLLAHLRTWGWSFNPIAFYVAFAPDGSGTIDALLAEVTNTPWQERHAYVMAVHATEVPDPVRFPKAMHVSPFLDMELDHSFAFTPFGAGRLTVRMDDWRGDRREFAATLDVQRFPLDRPTMGRMLRRHPLPAQRVSGGIYLEALKLRAKDAPFRRHPAKVGPARRTASLVPSPTSTPTPELARSAR